MTQYIHFDPNTRQVLGWFDTETHDVNLPPKEQIIEASESQWEKVDFTYFVSENGKLISNPPPSPYHKLTNTSWVLDEEAKKEADEIVEKQWATKEYSDTNNMVAVHRDEVEAGEQTTLSEEQYKELQSYRSVLRKWPIQGENRPSKPEWLNI